MKQISWNDITVEQFQEIYQLSLSTDIEEMARIERIISILYGLTQQEIEDLNMVEFNQLAKHCTEIMTGQIPGKPVRKIKVGKHKYSIIYDPSKLVHRQYVELMQYGDQVIDNLHLIMASIVQPTTWYGKKLKNNVDDHSIIAADMRNARLVEVYHCCVFFCKLFINSIQDIKEYLAKEMAKGAMTNHQLMQLINISQSIMAGSITLEKWPFLKT